MNKPNYIKMMVKNAIQNEKECNCPSHLNGRRLTDSELSAFKLIMSTGEGYQMVMGFFCNLITGHNEVASDFQELMTEMESEIEKTESETKTH